MMTCVRHKLPVVHTTLKRYCNDLINVMTITVIASKKLPHSRKESSNIVQGSMENKRQLEHSKHTAPRHAIAWTAIEEWVG